MRAVETGILVDCHRDFIYMLFAGYNYFNSHCPAYKRSANKFLAKVLTRRKQVTQAANEMMTIKHTAAS
jgi:hypothetical protein